MVSTMVKRGTVPSIASSSMGIDDEPASRIPGMQERWRQIAAGAVGPMMRHLSARDNRWPW